MEAPNDIKLLEERLALAEAQLAKSESTHRAREARQTFLLELSDALRPISDARDIQKTTTRMVGTHLGVDRTMYTEVDGALGAETGTIHAQFVRQAANKDLATITRFPKHFTFDQFGVHTMDAPWNDIEREILPMFAQVPLGRVGTLEEIANAVAFLSSPRAGYITGANLRLDGGMWPGT